MNLGILTNGAFSISSSTTSVVTQTVVRWGGGATTGLIEISPHIPFDTKKAIEKFNDEKFVSELTKEEILELISGVLPKISADLKSANYSEVDPIKVVAKLNPEEEIKPKYKALVVEDDRARP